MRIGFDLRPVFKPSSRRRGIGKFTAQLFHALLALRPEHQVLGYLQKGQVLESNKGREIPIADWTARHLWYLKKPSRLNWVVDWALLERWLSNDDLGIFHATDVTSIPISNRFRTWAHVLDTIPYRFWEETKAVMPMDFRVAMGVSHKRIREVDLVLTISECSKRDICEEYGVPESRVRIIYPGSNPRIKPVEFESAVAWVREKYRIEGPFLFYVGGSDFRKNLRRLVQAFAVLRQSGYPGVLVLCGETFLWDIQEVRHLRTEIDRQGLEKRIFFPGYVPDIDLAHFYSACDLFVFPSLFEGFGLPVLEAMKCGALVLTSPVSSLPEVGGETVLYADPYDSEALAHAMQDALGNRNGFEDLRACAVERSKMFSWEQSANRLLQLYDEF